MGICPVETQNGRLTVKKQRRFLSTISDEQPSKSVMEQLRRGRERFKSTRKIWELQNKRFIRNVDIYWWRNRYNMMEAATRAFVKVQNVPEFVGPGIHEWKGYSDKTGTVIRVIGDIVMSLRQSFTATELHARLPRKHCSLKTLQKIIDVGIDLKLLERDVHSDFMVTDKFIQQLQARVLWRDLDQDIVAWARQVVMLDTMIKTAVQTTENEAKGSLFDSGLRSISERLDLGDWDEEIGYVDPEDSGDTTSGKK